MGSDVGPLSTQFGERFAFLRDVGIWPAKRSAASAREDVCRQIVCGSPGSTTHSWGMELAQSRGLPVPRYLLIAPLGRTVAVEQERVPGNVRRLDVSRLEAMVEANERFEAVLAQRQDVPNIRMLNCTGFWLGDQASLRRTNKPRIANVRIRTNARAVLQRARTAGPRGSAGRALQSAVDSW
jgi:hypothetical protein